MKNAFYFMLKALFVLKIFKFLSLFVHVRKRLDKKRLILKFMTSQTGQQSKIHTLSNNPRNKANQTMILVKSYTKCGGEASPRPFL